tara:strand:+ start:1966 stop:2205 length:240 start_codon:yes stop_codon:yes gene_type:complete
MRVIRMIWDFKGMEAEQIAKHHAIHLAEFAKKHNLSPYKSDIIKMSDLYTIAHLDVNEEFLILVRDSLKPHRGEWIEEA